MITFNGGLYWTYRGVLSFIFCHVYFSFAVLFDKFYYWWVRWFRGFVKFINYDLPWQRFRRDSALKYNNNIRLYAYIEQHRQCYQRALPTCSWCTVRFALRRATSSSSAASRSCWDNIYYLGYYVISITLAHTQCCAISSKLYCTSATQHRSAHCGTRIMRVAVSGLHAAIGQ